MCGNRGPKGILVNALHHHKNHFVVSIGGMDRRFLFSDLPFRLLVFCCCVSRPADSRHPSSRQHHSLLFQLSPYPMFSQNIQGDALLMVVFTLSFERNFSFYLQNLVTGCREIDIVWMIITSFTLCPRFRNKRQVMDYT